MPRSRVRITRSGLMAGIAAAALLASWSRPMTRAEAVRLARQVVEAQAGAGVPPPYGSGRRDPGRWRVTGVVRDGRGDFEIRMAAEGPGDRRRAIARIDARHRRLRAATVGPASSSETLQIERDAGKARRW